MFTSYFPVGIDCRTPVTRYAKLYAKNFYAPYVLEKVITYNKSILKKLLQLTNNSIKNLTAFYESANGSFYSNSHYIHEAWKIIIFILKQGSWLIQLLYI